jgi:tRNA(adenine34) deaminase
LQVFPLRVFDDTHGMRLALNEAAQAAMCDEVPVGAVVVLDGRILGQGSNRRESDCDPSAHAEIVAMRRAAKAVGSWRLCDATLYVTQEPCPMCAGALVNARIKRLVYGCPNPKAGAVRTLFRIVDDARLNHRVEVREGVLADECGALLRRFFEALRSPAVPR